MATSLSSDSHSGGAGANKRIPLMLPGPEWPMLDFCYDPTVDAAPPPRFMIAGQPIYTHAATADPLLSTPALTGEDHAVRTATSVWDAVSGSYHFSCCVVKLMNQLLVYVT